MVRTQTQESELATPAQPSLSISIPDLLVEGSDIEFRAFMHDLLALSLRVQEIFARHAKHIKARYDIDLSATQLTLLTAVSRLQLRSPVLMRELAEFLRVSPSFVSMETNSLVQLGLLAKTSSPEDMRVQVLEITPEGWHVLHISSSEKVVVNDTWFAGVDGEEFQQIQESVRHLLHGANNAITRLKHLELEDKAFRKALKSQVQRPAQ